MAIPYIFSPGDIAAAAEVNSNFDFIMKIIGSNSTSTRMLPVADMVIGPRSNAQISARSDTTAGSDRSFLHIGWNAEWYRDGTVWKFRRFHDGEKAYAIRLGKGGVGIYASARTTGSLNSQLTLMANVGATTSNNDRDWFYVRDSFTNVNQSPTEHGQIRSTYVPLTEPITVYSNANISPSTLTRNAISMGIPEQACAVYLHFEGVAGSSDSTILFTRTTNNPLQQKYGFSVRQSSTNQGAGSGIVTLGMSGSHKGKFSEVRSNSWTSASLYIQGYFI